MKMRIVFIWLCAFLFPSFLSYGQMEEIKAKLMEALKNKVGETEETEKTEEETESIDDSMIIASPSVAENAIIGSAANDGISLFASGNWGFYHSEDYSSDQSSDTGERCYIMYSPSAYAKKRMPVNIHRAIAPWTRPILPALRPEASESF